MKTIIGMIFLVFLIVIGMNVIEGRQALFYNSVGINQSDHVATDDFLSDDDEQITYEITLSGEVVYEGIYTIEEGGFLYEVLNFAGGTTAMADVTCFDNYLTIVEDLAIYIPPITEEEKISLNNATLEDLMSLSGIGQTLGNKILDYRLNNGKFRYLEEIMKVSGIGQVMFEKIKDKICL